MTAINCEPVNSIPVFYLCSYQASAHQSLQLFSSLPWSSGWQEAACAWTYQWQEPEARMLLVMVFNELVLAMRPFTDIIDMIV